MTDHVLSDRGDRIAVDLLGDGPALVFVSGAGPHRAIDPGTTATAGLLAGLGVRTAVYDRPGRGESPADGTLDLDRDMAALRAVIEAVGAPAVLCGHSSGCAIALRAAVDGLPVLGVAMFEAPLATDAEDAAAWAAEFERLLDAGDVEAATVCFMRDMPPEWLAGVQASPIWPDIAAGARSQRADAQVLAWATAALRDGGLDKVPVPVLATYGTTTFDEMPVAADAVVAAVPDGRVTAVAGADHEWQPPAMAEVLRAFVAECTAR